MLPSSRCSKGGKPRYAPSNRFHGILKIIHVILPANDGICPGALGYEIPIIHPLRLGKLELPARIGVYDCQHDATIDPVVDNGVLRQQRSIGEPTSKDAMQTDVRQRILEGITRIDPSNMAACRRPLMATRKDFVFIETPSEKSQHGLMIDDFADLIRNGDTAGREKWLETTAKTQAFLDATGEKSRRRAKPFLTMNLKSEYERKSMNSLFEPYDLAGRTLRNRFVMAPMTRACAGDGVTDAQTYLRPVGPDGR